MVIHCRACGHTDAMNHDPFEVVPVKMKKEAAVELVACPNCGMVVARPAPVKEPKTKKKAKRARR